MRDLVEFVAPAPDPDTEPLPFALTMTHVETGEALRQTFVCRPPGTLSFGALIGVTSGPLEQVVYRLLEQVLVKDNSAPADKDDRRSEYERFREFLSSSDYYIDSDTLKALVEKLTEEYGERPTRPSGDSRATRRAAQHGSVATRPRRASGSAR